MTTEQIRHCQHQALLAFQRDLPALWEERPGQWVAYLGERQIGIAAQKGELHHLCLQRGHRREEYVVFCIAAQDTDIFMGPLVVD